MSAIDPHEAKVTHLRTIEERAGFKFPPPLHKALVSNLSLKQVTALVEYLREAAGNLEVQAVRDHEKRQRDTRDDPDPFGDW